MKVFEILLTVLLSVAITLSTCGLLQFLMRLVFLGNDQEWFLIFSIVDVCAIILLAGILHRMAAATAAIAVGALLHLFYAPTWSSRFQAFALAGDAIVIMIMMTVTYVCAQKRSRTSDTSIGKRKTLWSLWSALDEANKVAIVSALITAIAGIVAAMIGMLPGH